MTEMSSIFWDTPQAANYNYCGPENGSKPEFSEKKSIGICDCGRSTSKQRDGKWFCYHCEFVELVNRC